MVDDEEIDGTFNEEADKIERIDKTWSDTNLDGKIFNVPFERLVCRNCGGKIFEVKYRQL